MNPLLGLNQCGQFVWLDHISRSLIRGGGLQRLIDEDGLGGVTSNPTIFEKAIAGSSDYDAGLHRALDAERSISNRALAERLIVEDIQMTADVLRPVYDHSEGANGFVSLEVSPGSAHNTDATVAEARHLWQVAARPNVMIKVPATQEGVPAVEVLTAEGVNVNITLMFSLEHYEAVAQAYLRGIQRHPEPHRVTSVASVFVSRLDTVADRLLEKIGSPDALALRGRIAIANARRIYRRFREMFDGEPFATLKRRGARIQRPLWASTGTKNASYSDVLYIEALIGPDTITGAVEWRSERRKRKWRRCLRLRQPLALMCTRSPNSYRQMASRLSPLRSISCSSLWGRSSTRFSRLRADVHSTRTAEASSVF